MNNLWLCNVQVFSERDFQHPEQEDLQLFSVSLVSSMTFYSKSCALKLIKGKKNVYFEVRRIL